MLIIERIVNTKTESYFVHINDYKINCHFVRTF